MDKDQEYQDAFKEAEVVKPEMTEDEAFGLVPEEVNDAKTPAADVPSVAIIMEPGAPTETVADGGDGDAPIGDAMTPEDIQREKSWEGRLKKREEELKAREAELTAAPSAPIDAPDVEEAKAKLAEDFGGEFVDLIATIAAGVARQTIDAIAAEKVQSIDSSIEDVIEQIRDVNERAHFERIYDAHEDFAEIASDTAFQGWVAEDPERARIAAEGNAREIVKLLNDWKAANAPEDNGDDDAEAVRSSGGLKLPEPGPGMNKDYADAWKEF